jgi:hypothetical protein
MSCVGYELTVSAFERTKTVHALDRAATVIGTTARIQFRKKKVSCHEAQVSWNNDEQVGGNPPDAKGYMTEQAVAAMSSLGEGRQ